MEESKRHRAGFPSTDRFVVRTELGTGSVGTVYEAYDRTREEAVAVKVLELPEDAEPGSYAAPLREWMSLNHSALVVPYEILSIEGHWLVTSELLSGPDLSSAVKSTSRLRSEQLPRDSEWQTIREWASQALSAIAYLSQRGRVHGNVLPSNLLLDQNGRLRLTDPGLSQLFSQQVDNAMVSSFQAPELLDASSRAAPATEKSDLYSLGVVLYEGLTGIRPGAGRDRSPKSRREAIPGDLDELCLSLLQPRPEDRPDATTALSMIDRKPGSASEPAVGSDAVSFVGREKELEQLLSIASRLAGSSDVSASVPPQESLVWIRGRSGVGRTRLIEQFLDLQRLAREDTLVLRSVSHRQIDRPFKAVHGLVDALSVLPVSDLAAETEGFDSTITVFPTLAKPDFEQGPGDPGSAASESRDEDVELEREKAFGALCQMLTRLGERVPLILVFEDLHWGDADSALLFSELVCNPVAPYMVVASYRSEDYEHSAFLGALPPEVLARGLELHLGGLSDQEAYALAQTILSESDDEHGSQKDCQSRIPQIVAASGGNPLLLETLVFDQRRDSSSSLLSVSETPVSLQGVLKEQIAALSREAQALLEVLALAGMPISVELAMRAARLSVEHGAQLSEAGLLEVLESWGLVKVDSTPGGGRKVGVRHDQISRAVLAKLDAEERRKRHGVLAAAMEEEQVPVDSGVMAEHLRRYRDDERAAAYALAAADQAMEQLAFGRAAGLYRMVVELSHGHSGSELHVKFAEALRLSGRAVEAAGEYLNAIRVGGVKRVGELQLRAAEQLLISGHIDRGINILKHVFRGLKLKFPERAGSDLLSSLRFPRAESAFRRRPEREIPPEELLRVDAYWAGAVGLISTDPARAQLLQRRHLRAALRCGDAKRVARALAMEVFSASTGGTRTLNRTERLLEVSTELAEELGDPESLGRAALAAVMTESGIGHWDEAVRLGRQAALMLEERCNGVAWERRTNQDLLLQALNGLGAFREILERVPELLQDAEEHDDIYAQNQLGIWMSRARLIQDRPERARDELNEVRSRELGDLFRLPRLNAELIECEIGLYEGDFGVLDRLAELREEIVASNILKNQMLRVRLGILRARAALVQAQSQSGVARQACLRLAESSVAAVEKEGTDWGSTLARVVEAAIDAEQGKIDDAIGKYLAAERSAHAARTLVIERICCYRRGALLGGDEGAALRREAEQGLRSEGVAAPQRLCNLFAPDLRGR